MWRPYTLFVVPMRFGSPLQLRSLFVSRMPGRFDAFLTRRFVSTATPGGQPICSDSHNSAACLTAEEFSNIVPMFLLGQALRQHTSNEENRAGAGEFVITREVFNRYCSESHVEDTDKALQLLCESGVVVSISDGAAVHLRPVQFLQMHNDAADASDAKVKTPFEDYIRAAQNRLADAEAEEMAMRVALQPAIDNAAKRRRLLWSGALCLMAVQLAVISRLTFVDLDWDIMEPVSYFLGSGTSILFLIYLLRNGRVKSYKEYEEKAAASRVRLHAPADFEWRKYDAVVRRVEVEKNMVEQMRKWFKHH
ncbi:hypothetical protein, conserved [Trypanosoma brucei brucei TREU927]|uniref:Calcium uniporter protein C-terminal domain-containing protein n=1 Tax=Trypanosoma brucei brucei (strain 927/4 GUTat10.1) TaxID=185431 RepID=Q387B7_TRYB2|nr:hypothetical protein, conserved [Trypanosoma brucei brucei TREU927]EAN79114.1 hypothetical protein, conserved [Trypanosoma brucei brucei TREU927]